jgi:hypothetical protein
MLMEINLIDYKRFVKNLSDDELDSLGDDYTACWLFAYYIHDKYILPISNYDCVYETNIDINDFKLDNDGIYSCFFEHKKEMHHFVLFVSGDNLILRATYGGQKGIINIKYNKNDFIQKFQNLIISKNIKEYSNLFGIIEPSFNELDFINVKFSYSYREL